MNIGELFDPFYFLVAFFVGLLMVYMFTPVPEVIIKYPTPENGVVYKDRTDKCYRFVPKKQEQCGKDAVETMPTADGSKSVYKI